MDRSDVFSSLFWFGEVSSTAPYITLSHQYHVSFCVQLCTQRSPGKDFTGLLSPQGRDSQIQDVLGSPQGDC